MQSCLSQFVGLVSGSATRALRLDNEGRVLSRVQLRSGSADGASGDDPREPGSVQVDRRGKGTEPSKARRVGKRFDIM